MRLSWIELRDFRNHRETRLDTAPGLTAVVGDNGQGKTNLLEGIYFAFALESPRTATDLPLVRSGAASGFVRAEIETATGRVLVEVEVRPTGANRVQVNRSTVRRARDLWQRVRAVFFGPDDIQVVQGDPDERRRFMDQAVRSLWPAREANRRAYERALRQRNRLLKDWGGAGEPADLEAWDEELVESGSRVIHDRDEAVGRIRDEASRAFAALSGGDELAVAYRPSTDAGEAFRARLAERRGDELVRRTTLSGPHRDELDLGVRALKARGFASHGEAWVGALSLRLALAAAVAEEVGEEPVVLLDDPFSGLDPARRTRLAAALAERDRQTLLSVPDPGQAPIGATTWEVHDGSVRAA